MASEKNDREEIRPIYSELQGYLSQAPKSKTSGALIYGSTLWEQYNSAVIDLNNISGHNYDRFKVTPHFEINDFPRVEIDAYRAKLGGLISRLHSEYFSDEAPPFSGMPSTVISQVQQQSQSVYVQMLLEVNSKIEQKLPEFPEGTKERKFLQKVKDSLSSIKDTVGLIALLVNTAKECGLSIDVLKSIFG